MKTARILLAAAALTAAAAPALAGDWKFLPVTEKGYAPAFVASVTGGVMDPQHVKSGDAWGLELAMPLIGWVMQSHGWRATALGSAVVILVLGWPLASVLRRNPAEVGGVSAREVR